MAVQTVRIQEGTGPLVAELAFGAEEYQRRLAGVRAKLAEQNLAAFIS
jgi:hypothetical protein